MWREKHDVACEGLIQLKVFLRKENSYNMIKG